MKTPVISSLHTVFIPAKNKDKLGHKLMLVLHGLGDSLEGYTWLPSELGRDDISFLLINAPDQYFTGYSWFDIYENPAPGIIRSRDLLFKTVQELEVQGWKTDEIALFGFSQGCVMSLDLAFRYPKKFAAVVGISGFVYFLEEYPGAFSAVAREQKILVTHGMRDPLLPLSLPKPQMEGLQKLGANIRWKEYEKVHTIDPYQELQDIKEFLYSSGF